MGVKNIQANVDSKLVANQVLGTYVAKEDNMIKYLEIAKGLVSGFKAFSISQVPWSKNKKADALSKIANRGRRSNLDDGVSELLERSDCQTHRLVTRHPQQPLTPITAPWPFYKWGIYIACPFPEGPGKVKFLIFAMDYFTEWIEAKAVATITGGQVKKFVWDNIVCRFDVVNNDEELRLNLDLLEERRELAAINEARSKSKMTKYYNSRVRGVAFQPGNLVYRSNDASHAAAGGKLGPKWEGPYEVTDALGNGAYKLRTRDGTMLPRTWNVTNLKRCYL
nr:protein NYNRIN-like [Tanacetum cinerariifolium]